MLSYAPGHGVTLWGTGSHQPPVASQLLVRLGGGPPHSILGFLTGMVLCRSYVVTIAAVDSSVSQTQHALGTASHGTPPHPLVLAIL